MTDRPKDGATSAPTKRARRGIRLDSKLNRPPLDFAAVGAAARGRWTWILTTLGVDPAHLDGKHRPCPGCGGTDRFRFDDKDDGRWICSQGGGERAYGDGFELLGHVHGWTHAESLHRVAELLGLSDEARDPPAAPPPKPSTPSTKPDKAAAQAKAAETARTKWEQLHPAETTHPYLARKGLTAAFGARIDTKGDLVLPLHDEQGRVQSLQHIPSGVGGKKRFLPAGSRSAHGRYMLATGLDDSPIAITEGFADAASIALAMPDWCVVCAFSADNVAPVALDLRALHPERVILAATDRDPAGDNAARRAAQRAAALPLQPAVSGADWNDVLIEHGIDGLRQALDEARQKVEVNNPLNSLDSLESWGELTRNPLETLSSPSRMGFLLYRGKQGVQRRVESLAAEQVADRLRDRLAFDAEAFVWFLWSETHWQPLQSSARAERLIADVIHEGTDPIGFRPAYLSGVVTIVQKRCLLPRPPAPKDVVPFQNGLLDLHTRALRPASPDHALDWVLPHSYDAQADCPTIRGWLMKAVENDAATVELLRAWIAALVRGLSLQVFLMLIGRGGSGKGTFQRLVSALIGISNTAISTLQNLETNRFETAKLHGKRLCMINESGRHGGELNMLKAITGGDHIPIERKNVQQTGSFVFEGLVLMATNEPMVSSDSTSGLERRRITVRFPRSATPEDRAEWRARGGEEGVLHVEIPGLVNWALDLPLEKIRDTIDRPPERVQRENLFGMSAGNSVAEWMMSECIPSPPKDGASPMTWQDPPGEHWTPIGVRREKRESGALVFEHREQWLYANYLAWCSEQARQPVSIVRFGSILIDIGETLGCQFEPHQHTVLRSKGIKGIRLRRYVDGKPSEDSYDWLGSREGSTVVREGHETVEPAQRLASRGSRDFSGNSLPENAEVF